MDHLSEELYNHRAQSLNRKFKDANQSKMHMEETRQPPKAWEKHENPIDENCIRNLRDDRQKKNATH